MGLNFKLSASFYPLLKVKERYLMLCGGRGSGKSEFAARKLLYRMWVEHPHRFLVIRKVRRTLGESVVKVFEELLRGQGVGFDYNKTDRVMRILTPKGVSELIFDGLDDPEKIKSIKGISGIWCEEMTELTREDFLTLDLCLREPVKSYHQIIGSFNPMESEARWIKEMFFGAERWPGSYIHKSTIEDNPVAEVRRRYLPILEALREQDEALWRIARLGEWASRVGRIYEWEVGELPEMAWDEVFYGLDFGYSVDPAAVVKVYRRADEFWVEEMLYERGLTNQVLGQRLREMGVGECAVYCDSAEPKSIEELRRMGIRARASEKGADSVRAGIDYIKGLKVKVVRGSINLVKEMNGYMWRKDKAGNLLPEPVAWDNHLMDAVRYAIYSHCKRGKVSVWRI